MAEMDRQRGERIRELRDAHAWTQRQLADRLGVDPKTVHNWEAGKEINPTNLRELSECLKVSMDFIRYGEREAPDIGDLLDAPAAAPQLDIIQQTQQEILAELAASRVEIGLLSTQIEELRQMLAQRSGTGVSGTRTQLVR